MSKEMKMADYFSLPVSDSVLEVIHDCIINLNERTLAPFKAADHAINNYDRLVDENKKLREFCESLQLDVSNEIKLERLLSEMDGEHE